jgi:hypothetical protein
MQSGVRAMAETVHTRVLGAAPPANVPAPIAPAALPPRAADPRVVDASTPDRYFVSDATNSELRATAAIDGQGVVSLDFEMVLPNGTRSTVLRGREQFDRVMEHFRGRVNAVQGYWVYGDNLAAINRLTRPPHNLTLEQAAARTWTGEQAARHGFTRVRIDPDQIRSRRSLVPPFRRIYQEVRVRFERP